MKTWLHNKVAIDTLFRDKLEELPVDLTGKAMHWQLVRQQMKAATANTNAHNTPIGHIMGYTIAGLLILTLCVQQVSVYRPSEESQQEVAQPAAPVTGDTAKATQTENRRNGKSSADNLSAQPVSGKQVKTEQEAANVSAGPPQPIVPGNKSIVTPDTLTTIPGGRRDSSSTRTREAMKKDSVFIFW